MSAKDVLNKMARNSVTLLYLCNQAQVTKAIPKKDYAKIKDVVQEIRELAGELP